MTIVGVAIVLCVVGVLLWLVNQYLPMQPPFKTLVNVVVVIAVVLWLLSAFGVLGSITGARLPRVRRKELFMFSHCKLGLKPRDPWRVSGVRPLHTLVASDPLIAEVPRDWAQGRPWDDDVLGNSPPDDLGDCGPAACVNALKLISDVAGLGRTFTKADALAAYEAMGWDGTPATDNGVVLLDLLEHWQDNGIGGIRLDCFFRVGFDDPAHLATALAMGGPLIAGFTLPNACQTTDQWDAAAAADTSVWGGHAVMVHAFSPGLIRVKSWGKPVDITPEFLAAKCTEMYLPCSEAFRVPGALNYISLLQLAGKL
jgi:hypothetical protein